MLLLLYYLLTFILGLISGSFLNACVWRARENIKIYRGRSICPNCRQTIAWYDNLPILSFIILRGKCRLCQGKISCRYPLVELAVGIIFVALAWHWRRQGSLISPELIRDWLIAFVLVFTFVYDFKYREILSGVVLPAAILLFLAAFCLNWRTVAEMLLGVLVVGGFFLAQYLISSGSWLGGGDVWLGIFMGVILGWPVILAALFVAYISGAAVSLLLVLFKKRKMDSETAFGTYLTFGTLVAMIWGQRVVEWYLGLIQL